MRWLRYIAYTIITLVIIIFILFVLLVTTNTGLRIAFAIAKHATPGKTEIGQINGRLISSLTLKNVSYRNDDVSVNVNHVYLKGSLLPLIVGNLKLKTFTVQGVYYQTLENKKLAIKTKENSKQTKTSYKWEGLPIRINIPSVDIKDVTIDQQGNIKKINHITFGIKTSGQQVTVKQFKLLTPNYQAMAQGKVLAKAPFTTQFHAELKGSPNREQLADVKANVNGDANKLTIAAQTTQPFKSNLNIVFTHLIDNPGIDASMDWQHAAWVINGFSSISMQQGRAIIKGPLNNYQFSIATDISGSKIPFGNWSVNGSGNFHSLQIKQLTSETLGGKLEANASINWQTAIIWQASINAQNINPGLQWSRWEGNLNFSSTFNGQYNSKQQQLNNHLVVSTLSGNLHKYDLTGQADINLANKQLFIKQLTVKLGQNHLNASGQLAQQWDLNWQAKLPNLTAIWKHGVGQFNSEGSIRGSLKQPIVKATAEGKNIKLPWLSLDAITANINLGADANAPANVQVELDNLHVQTHHIKTIRLLSQGTIANQKINGSLVMPKFTLNTKLAGGITQQQWQGELQKLNINTTDFGNWQLKQRAQLMLKPNSLALANTCLVNQSESVCGGLNWQAQRMLQASLKSSGLNVGMLSLFFPNNLNVDAPINIDMDIDSNVDGKQSGYAKVMIPQGKMAYTYKGQTQDFAIKNSSIVSQLSSDGINTQINAATDPNQTLTGTISLPKLILIKGWNPKQPLQGSIDLNAPDLSWLAAIVGPLENTKGSIVGKLNIAGNVQQPKLSGFVALNNGSAFIAPLDITPTNINLDANFTPNQGVTYKGSLLSEKGKLTLNGQTQLNSFFKTTLFIKGDNVLGIDTPEYKAYLSPDLKLTYDKPKLTLSGKLNVTNATLKPKTFSSTTTLPDNIVYIRPEGEKDPLQFYLDLNLGLKNVSFAYQGLKAEVEGQLKLHLEPDSIMTATGELRTTSGSYKAYNQDLTIEKGNFVYNGGPLSNPSLDISATRKIQTVFDASSVQQTLTVGVNITGTIRRPQLNLFSSPVTLSQADILSYIIFGHGTNTASGGQGQLLLAAASSMGLTDNKLTQNLQKTFGLSELGLQSDEIMNQQGSLQSNTSLVVGKQITPKFSIRYSAGLLVPVDVFRMVYQLSRRWSVQTDSSTYDNGADIIYTIETG